MASSRHRQRAPTPRDMAPQQWARFRHAGYETSSCPECPDVGEDGHLVSNELLTFHPWWYLRLLRDVEGRSGNLRTNMENLGEPHPRGEVFRLRPREGFIIGGFLCVTCIESACTSPGDDCDYTSDTGIRMKVEYCTTTGEGCCTACRRNCTEDPDCPYADGEGNCTAVVPSAYPPWSGLQWDCPSPQEACPCDNLMESVAADGYFHLRWPGFEVADRFRLQVLPKDTDQGEYATYFLWYGEVDVGAMDTCVHLTEVQGSPVEHGCEDATVEGGEFVWHQPFVVSGILEDERGLLLKERASETGLDSDRHGVVAVTVQGNRQDGSAVGPVSFDILVPRDGLGAWSGVDLNGAFEQATGTKLLPGSYEATFTYADAADSYNPSNTVTLTFSVVKSPTTTAFEAPSPVKADTNFGVTATVARDIAGPPPPADGRVVVEFLRNGEWKKWADMDWSPQRGRYEATLNLDATGTYTMRARYVGDPRHLSSASDATETEVERWETEVVDLRVLPSSLSPEDTVEVRGRVERGDGKGVAGDIVIEVDGAVEAEPGATINGFAATLRTFDLGSHTLTASFAGDESYEPSSTSTTFEVVKTPTVLSMEAQPSEVAPEEPVEVSGTLETKGGEPLGGETVALIADAQEETTMRTDTRGQFAAVLSFSTAAEHVLQAVFPGGASLESSESNKVAVTVTTEAIEKVETALTLTASSPEAGRIEGEAVLTDAEGGPIPEAEVAVLMDGVEEATVRTNPDGLATFSLHGVSGGMHTVFASFAGKRVVGTKYQPSMSEKMEVEVEFRPGALLPPGVTPQHLLLGGAAFVAGILLIQTLRGPTVVGS